MATETIAKATLHQRAVHELKELAILTAYLYVTLGAVIVMKTAVLHTHGIDSALWGIAIVKALVLAKFMLIGEAMKIGERNTTSPLIWPTLHRAFAFLVLLIILTVIEEAVVGLIHHQSIASSLGDLFGARLEETARWHPHHAAGAHSIFRLSRPQRGAWRRPAGEDVLCRA